MSREVDELGRAGTEPAMRAQGGRMSRGEAPNLSELVRALQYVEEKADRALVCLVGDVSDPHDLGLRGMVDQVAKEVHALRSQRWPLWIAAVSLAVIAIRSLWLLVAR